MVHMLAQYKRHVEVFEMDAGKWEACAYLRSNDGAGAIIMARVEANSPALAVEKAEDAAYRSLEEFLKHA